MTLFASCPKCGVLNGVVVEQNLLGEEVRVIRCKECSSLSVSRDSIHWWLDIQNNVAVKRRG